MGCTPKAVTIHRTTVLNVPGIYEKLRKYRSEYGDGFGDAPSQVPSPRVCEPQLDIGIQKMDDSDAIFTVTDSSTSLL